MKKYMKEKATTLMYKQEYGIGNKRIKDLLEVMEYIDNHIIFTSDGGSEGNDRRLEQVNIHSSFHNNNIELQLGNDVGKGDIKYTYIFGCPSMNFIRLIGYFKNNDLEHNYIKKEHEFDIGSLKDFIYDRAYNYLNELEKEDEWLGEFEYQKEFEEMEAELE